MKLSKYLDRAAAPALRIPTLDLRESATALPANPRCLPTSLLPWDDFDDGVKDLLEPHLEETVTEITSKELKREKSPLHIVNQKSTLVNLAIQRFEAPTKRILRNILHVDGYFDHHDPSYHIGQPDRMFAKYPTGRHKKKTSHSEVKARLVVEYKTPWTLPLPDDIITTFNEHSHGEVVKAVQQLYGYMHWNDVEIGVLSNHDSTFFFQRTEDARLRVSRCYKRSDRGLRSTVAALTYVCYYTCREGYRYYSPPVNDGAPGPRILDFDVQSEIISDESRVPWGDMAACVDRRSPRNAGAVVRGRLYRRGGSSEEAQKWERAVVCKIYDLSSAVSRENAGHEIAMYSDLRDVQGHFIPRLYAAGTHCGILKILILEDCGVSAADIVRDGCRLPETFWLQARRALRAVHDRSILHGDLRMHNIVVSSGEVRLIDLGGSVRAPEKRREAAVAYQDELRELEELQRRYEGRL
ncbi:hypothetical protein Dda_6865 [Drechslerella dactyloides]|uniref:EKC/KEOPS complex subunit BUD32 n=1 Tax=Drechslerella dactyloides TaxID=74499 RepID=A0AAD6IYB4_DREDA|nr:hypothetical protein Dda_6865 [Drechslerella dactyloides]